MKLASLSFVIGFLPLALLALRLTPLRWRRWTLTALGLVFCALSGPVGLAAGLGTLAVCCVGCRLVAGRRWLRWALVALHVGALLALRMADMAPAGLAVMTLSALAAERDAWAGQSPAATLPELGAALLSPAALGTGAVATDRTLRAPDYAGCTALVRGLCLQAVLGGALLAAAETCRAAASPTGLDRALYLVLLALGLWYVLAGWDALAMGLGALLGQPLPPVFRRPLESDGPAALEKRLFAGALDVIRSFFPAGLGWLSWLVLGLWLRSDLLGLIWGAVWALAALAEERGWCGRAVTGALLLVSGLLLAAPSASALTGALAGVCTVPFAGAESLYHLRCAAVLLAIAVAGLTPLPRALVARLRRYPWAEAALALAGLVLALAFLLTSAPALITL